MIKVDQFPDRSITIDGLEMLYFGGTSYLGMATHTEFQKIFSNNLAKWGSCYGSSRSSNVQLSVYDRVEEYFSKWVGAESSLMLSSGTLAGNLVVEYLSKSVQKFFHYPKTHPAVLAKKSTPVVSNCILHPTLLDNVPETIVIAVDAILSLEVIPSSFELLDQISNAKKVILVVDESHSLGLIGPEGSGVYNKINHQKIYKKVMISSLAKAMGLSGGVIAGDFDFIRALKSEPTFVSASGASPAFLETFIDAEKLYHEQRQKLKRNLDFVFSKLKPNDALKYDKNYPVIYSNNDAIFTTLQRHQIIITRFKYPTYEKAMNRIVISANHTKEDLRKLISILNNYDK